MLNLFGQNYRQADLEKISQCITTNNKIWVQYVYGVGKNSFVQYLDLKIRQLFPKVLIITFDSKTHNIAKTNVFDFLYCAICNELKIRAEKDNLTWFELVSWINEVLAIANFDKLILNIQFNDLDPSLLEPLNLLRQSDPGRIIPIIHSYWNLSREGIIDCDLLNGARILIKPFSKDEFPQALSYFEKKNRTLSEQEREVFWNLSGGIPKIYKQIFLFAEEEGIRITDQGFLEKFLQSKRAEDLMSGFLYYFGKQGLLDSKVLMKLDLADEKGVVKAKILSELILKIGLLKDYQQIFTKIELDILNALKSSQTVVSREQIANIIWKDAWHEHYSDYAIDKHISNIRAKVMSNNLGKIITSKKFGFRFQS
jgi:hypothetical protein